MIVKPLINSENYNFKTTLVGGSTAELAGMQIEDTREGKEFKKVTKDIDSIISKFDGLIEKASKSDQNWFLKILSKMI